MGVTSPDPGRQLPNLAGFGNALDRLRAQTGHAITFFWPQQVTFPMGVALAPETGRPYDPLAASAGTATQASASATCAAFFKAINRGGASNADISSPIGHLDLTRCFLNLDATDGALVEGLASAWAGVPFGGYGSAATTFSFHGTLWKIYAIKDDEILGTYRRTLVYAAAEGSSLPEGIGP
jgi:hypothetical protein